MAKFQIDSIMKPSIKKVTRDLLSNKSRSLIVLLAIVLGAFGVSMMSTAYNLLGKNLSNNYLKTNPASFTIVADSVSDEVIQKMKLLPNMEYIESRNKIVARVEISENEFIPIWLFVVDDFKTVQINTFRLLKGNSPVSGNEILIERTGERLTDISLNKQYQVTIPGFGKSNLKISGVVHDPGQAPSWMEGLLYGYVNRDLVEKMNITQLPSELKFTIRNNKYDLPTIENQLKQTVTFLERNQVKVCRTEILPPGRHIHQSQMDSLMFLLQMFGVLALLLSCFLIINMIMAIMAKEIRQIGVMKAIGAGTAKITSIYLTIVLIFGFAATLVALPLGFLAGKSYATFVASMLNFELFDLQISHRVWTFQIAIGTLLPALVSFFPVYRTSRISVREALNDYGVKDNVSLSTSHSAHFLDPLKLSNATLFAIRNTFRRKGRLILTLITLVLGGAVFISAFNIRTSLKNTVQSRFTNQRYDIQAIFAKGINEFDFRSSIDSLQFVSKYEVWGSAKATRIRIDHPESELVDVKVVPLQTELFIPEIIKGKWLSGNADEVVVNHLFLSQFPDVSLGNEITLKINGLTKKFKVVGSIRELFAIPTVYVSKSILTEIPGMQGKMNSVLIAYLPGCSDMTANSSKLEQWFKSKNYPTSLVFRKDNYKDRVIDHLVVITTMLIMVTLLLIIVGGLGLITTMGINIVERLRELAILRAIGVTDRKLYGLTITEGFVIGVTSWVLALILSAPVSYYLGNKFFNIFFETTLNFKISGTGIVVWLAIIVVFSAVAVLVPARNTIKQSVAQGLCYE
jgi:putative ABC transport system permease protein